MLEPRDLDPRATLPARLGAGGPVNARPVDPVTHLALAADWAAAQVAGVYEVSTRGRSLAQEGFVHAAFPHQVDGVARRFYADVTEPLVLLEIDPGALDAEVVVEAGDPADPSSERFPHVYGPIPVSAVVSARPFALPERAAQPQPPDAEDQRR
ncbi:DUF952 domain-containing protein [Pseudactinotalea terrae]|uniref:DUF952 domain-containing protein n=1 Tax=Pseudactinotalea terrae TaxID=1743262 RepID=UPI001F4F7D36|nr:DUF952 domain-containing protein [Pseudactinotalea terrae]